MIRSSSERIKNTIRESKNFKKDISNSLENIIENDKAFFEAMLLYAEGLLRTFKEEDSNKLEGKARDMILFSYIEMLYAILYTLEKNGFIKMREKTDRIANDVFDEYIKSIK